jgi:hypothetical protein
MNSSSTEFATILTHARSPSRHDAKSMVTALQQAEISARREKLAIPFVDLAGEWRLCFATGASKSPQKPGIKLGKGYYLPKFVFASIAFTPDIESTTAGMVTNQLKVGGFELKFTGPCTYPGKKNLLVFDFTQIQISVLGQTVYQGKIRSGKKEAVKDTIPESLAQPPLETRRYAKVPSIGKMPFFAFFWASPTGIAARGRGGGLALWIKEDVEV